MKKLLGVFLSLQLALILLFAFQSPAYAQWERGMYRENIRQENMMYGRQENYNLFHSFGDMMYRDSSFFTYAPVYKVAVDIILSILFITFFSKFIMTVFGHMTASPFKNGYFGFTFLVIFPIISVILLGLLWLGIASFLIYGLMLLVGIFLAKIFIGWGILRKIEKGYVLDWKAGIVGPLTVFILLFIPILGWLVLAIIFSMAVGGLLQELKPFATRQKLAKKTRE